MSHSKEQKSKLREEVEVFKDVEALCLTPGYAHVVAAFYFRDNTIKVREKLRPEDMTLRGSQERLIRTELSVLSGLMVKGEKFLHKIDLSSLTQLMEKTEQLLSELHTSMFKGFDQIFHA